MNVVMFSLFSWHFILDTFSLFMHVSHSTRVPPAPARGLHTASGWQEPCALCKAAPHLAWEWRGHGRGYVGSPGAAIRAQGEEEAWQNLPSDSVSKSYSVPASLTLSLSMNCQDDHFGRPWRKERASWGAPSPPFFSTIMLVLVVNHLHLPLLNSLLLISQS